MGISAENSLWYKEKGGVLREFKKNTGAILSAVASRNFSSLPGFAIEAFIDVEIDSKIKLTEYNQKIMGDAIDRELKALGLENDIALKQATMAWELEKMQLFSDLQMEFADKELVRSLLGEEIGILMIDQEIREIGVLLSKTAIEIEIEGIKRQKEEVELLSLPMEDRLAAARMATAQRKLSVIPYIRAALDAQSAALDTEAAVIVPAREQKANYDTETANVTTNGILPLMEAKASAILTLTSKQTELISLMTEKAQASVALAEMMIAQLANHRSLVAEKGAMADAKVLRLSEELVLMGKELTIEGSKITIERDRAAIELQRADAKLAVAEALRLQLAAIRTAMTNESAAEITLINTQGSNEVAIKKSYIDKVEAAKYDAQKTELDSQKSAVTAMGNADGAHSVAMAKKSANANITEKLIHLLE
ncbi:MAG: hypothetical protein ACOYOS_00220 [Syntrophales bacterium]